MKIINEDFDRVIKAADELKIPYCVTDVDFPELREGE